MFSANGILAARGETVVVDEIEGIQHRHGSIEPLGHLYNIREPSQWSLRKNRPGKESCGKAS